MLKMEAGGQNVTTTKYPSSLAHQLFILILCLVHFCIFADMIIWYMIFDGMQTKQWTILHPTRHQNLPQLVWVRVCRLLLHILLFYLLFIVRYTPPPILFCLTQGAKLNLNIFLSLTSNPQEVHLLPNSVWPEAVSCFGNQLATKLVINFYNLNLFSGPEFQRKHFSAEV